MKRRLIELIESADYEYEEVTAGRTFNIRRAGRTVGRGILKTNSFIVAFPNKPLVTRNSDLVDVLEALK